MQIDLIQVKVHYSNTVQRQQEKLIVEFLFPIVEQVRDPLSLSFLLISLSHLNTDGSHFHTYKSVEITFTFSLSHRCTKEITPIPSHFQFNTFTQVSQRSCLSLLHSFAFTLYHPGGPMKIHTFTSSLSYFQIITFSILNFHFPTFTLSHFYPGEPIKLAHFHNFTLSHC